MTANLLAVQVALDANDLERRRLVLLVASLDDHALVEAVHGRWTVAAKLAHLAYWDRFALALLGRWASGEAYTTDTLPPFHLDVLNDAQLSEHLALPPREAARLAIVAAGEVDAFLHGLPAETAARLLTDHDAGWLLRRHNHRAEHLLEIDIALGLQGC